MSPRPRTVPDADVLHAASRAIYRLGPARLTLADVAREAGLAPATLVQRFGSKRGLLLALAELAVASVDQCFATVRASHRSPLAALVAAATDMTRHLKSPKELANGLAFLQLDMTDRDFRRLALENSRRMQAGYERLIDEAVTMRELVRCDTVRLARSVSAIAAGSLISWAVLQQGPAEQWVNGDLATLLAPYRPRKKPRRASGRRGRMVRPAALSRKR